MAGTNKFKKPIVDGVVVVVVVVVFFSRIPWARGV